jgi:hypothetical protein
MNAVSNHRGRSSSEAVAVEMPFPGMIEGSAMREKLILVRDTLVVLGIQIAFRAAMLLRRWNM